MSISILLMVACMFGLMGLIAVAVLLWPSRRKKSKGIQDVSNESAKSTHPGWRSWIIPIVIAAVLAIWSLALAIFFLAVVWILCRDPKMDGGKIPYPNDQDRKRAKGTYTWLLLSPFLNVPILLVATFTLSSRSPINARVIAALIPLIIHLPVLIRLDSNSPFVFRHTQQAILLLALRTGMAALALNIGRYPTEGVWLFLIGNGFLWLFGSFWGRSQAQGGTCWLIKQRGEIIVPLGPQPIDKPLPETELDDLLKPVNAESRQITYEKSLSVFRSGTPEVRKKAVQMLSKLGEVEIF